MGALSLLIALPSGDFALPQSGREWGMMAMLVLVCSCFGFAFQPLGQKHVTAEAAAIFTVINPLTASAIGLIVASERITVSKIIGYILILFALVLYNLDLSRLRRARQNG